MHRSHILKHQMWVPCSEPQLRDRSATFCPLSELTQKLEYFSKSQFLLNNYVDVLMWETETLQKYKQNNFKDDSFCFAGFWGVFAGEWVWQENVGLIRRMLVIWVDGMLGQRISSSEYWSIIPRLLQTRECIEGSTCVPCVYFKLCHFQ